METKGNNNSILILLTILQSFIILCLIRSSAKYISIIKATKLIVLKSYFCVLSFLTTPTLVKYVCLAGIILLELSGMIILFQMYPMLFEGYGYLKGEVNIKVKTL